MTIPEKPLPDCLGPNDRVALFDGVCVVCNGLAKFVCRHDSKKAIKLASLQSNSGQSILAWCGLPLTELNTIVFVDRGRVHFKSGAALRLVRYLDWPWPVFSILLIIPWFIRDFLYTVFARYRYNLFGKKESCMLPTPEMKQRFLP
jgi:predicted DCC family thiol-disulfide oxidoreductase YuxK